MRNDEPTAGASSRDRADDGAAVRGRQQIFQRTVFAYLFTGVAILIYTALGERLAHPVFSHASLPNAAPILTIGATVAIGLHVAVFNLTHDKPGSSRDPDVLARLDVFASAGYAVAMIAAAAGWLLIWPSAANLEEMAGLDLLGGFMSVVVVLVAGMAGHIVPRDAVEELDQARRRHDRAWPARAVAHWRFPRPLARLDVLRLSALCVVPTLVVAVGFAGPHPRVVGGAFAWSLLVSSCPVLALVAFDRVLHRRYWWAMLVAGLGAAVVTMVVVAMAGELTDEATSTKAALGFVAAACLSWFCVLRSAWPVPAGRVWVPRVARVLICRSLKRRLDARARSGPMRLPSFLTKTLAWFRAASGRDEGTVRREQGAREPATGSS